MLIKTNLGGGKRLFQPTLPSPSPEEARNSSTDQGGLLTGLISKAHTFGFCCNRGPSAGELAPLTVAWALLHQPSDWSTGSLMKAHSQLNSPLPRVPS